MFDRAGARSVLGHDSRRTPHRTAPTRTRPPPRQAVLGLRTLPGDRYQEVAARGPMGALDLTEAGLWGQVPSSRPLPRKRSTVAATARQPPRQPPRRPGRSARPVDRPLGRSRWGWRLFTRVGQRPPSRVVPVDETQPSQGAQVIGDGLRWHRRRPLELMCGAARSLTERSSNRVASCGVSERELAGVAHAVTVEGDGQHDQSEDREEETEHEPQGWRLAAILSHHRGCHGHEQPADDPQQPDHDRYAHPQGCHRVPTSALRWSVPLLWLHATKFISGPRVRRQSPRDGSTCAGSYGVAHTSTKRGGKVAATVDRANDHDPGYHPDSN
jgi:hypothetical protein